MRWCLPEIHELHGDVLVAGRAATHLAYDVRGVAEGAPQHVAEFDLTPHDGLLDVKSREHAEVAVALISSCVEGPRHEDRSATGG